MVAWASFTERGLGSLGARGGRQNRRLSGVRSVDGTAESDRLASRTPLKRDDSTRTPLLLRLRPPEPVGQRCPVRSTSCLPLDTAQNMQAKIEDVQRTTGFVLHFMNTPPVGDGGTTLEKRSGWTARAA